MVMPMGENQHCTDVQIVLVGKNQFQNELFASNLKKIHDCQCIFKFSESLAHLPESVFAGAGQKTVICLDCYGLKIDELPSLLSTVCSIAKAKNILSLFNLPHENGAEKIALTYGVRGFFYSDSTPDDFCRGVRCLQRGELWLSRGILTRILLAEIGQLSMTDLQAGRDIEKLTRREKEILKLVMTGANNKEIADELCLSAHTIRTNLYNVFRKINVTNRTKASLWASKHLR